MSDKSGSAFPVDLNRRTARQELGLSKREWFAGMAMMGYNAQRHPNMGRADKVVESLADADALLDALKEAGEHD